MKKEKDKKTAAENSFVWWRRLYFLLFKNDQSAFLRATARKQHSHGDGLWVYYESYADFKRQKRKTRLIGLGSILIIFAVVVVSLVVNLLFPVIFKSKAYTGSDKESAEAKKSSAEKPEAGKRKIWESDGGSFDGGYTPLKDSLSMSNIVGLKQKKPTINQGYAYTAETSPAIGHNHVSHSWLDTKTNLLYVSTWGGLSVIDTKGTIDPRDDALIITYNLASQPALNSNYVYHSWLDTKTNLLYVSTWGGLSVIDTKGTIDPQDDTLAAYYSINSQPAIGYNKVSYSFKNESTGLLYICTEGGGLDVIDTGNTADQTDDELAAAYTKETSPAIPDDRVRRAYLDKATGLLYIATWGGGLAVIDTKNTTSQTDDQLLGVYGQSGDIKIKGDKIFNFTFGTNGLLYIGTSNGLSVVDTRRTPEFEDDLIVNPGGADIDSLEKGQVSQIYFDQSAGYLYAGVNGGGLFVIDSQQTTNREDDNLLFKYTVATQPALASDNITDFFVSPQTIYAATENNGLSVITPGVYNKRAVFVSQPVDIANQFPRSITWRIESGNNGSAAIQYRVGNEDSYWREDFNRPEAAVNIVQSLWGNSFGNITVKDSKLIMRPSEPEKNNLSFSLKGAAVADYFPAGSIIRVRLKASTTASSFSGVMFGDQWEDTGVYFNEINEWEVITLRALSPFSSVGFNFSWASGNWRPEDSLEIDWSSIEQPSSGWSEWSQENSNQDNVLINGQEAAGKKWIQYRLNFNSISEKKAPVLESIALFGRD